MAISGNSTIPARSVSISGVLALPGDAGQVDYFSLVARCPERRSWKIGAIRLYNASALYTIRVNLQLVPKGWIGSPSSDLLIVYRNLLIEPRDHFEDDAGHSVGPGASLWAYQLEDSGAATGIRPISISIAAEQH